VFFRIVADYADYFSALWTTVQKIIGIVAYNMEKWSALLATTQENVRI
jgi:hypothetical protein